MGWLSQMLANTENQSKVGVLETRLSEILPEESEEQLKLMTCLAGLLARVAISDFKIEDSERDFMVRLIKERHQNWASEAENIVRVALECAEELSGIENHLYCAPLLDQLDEKQRYHLIETLFLLSAADQDVSNTETEEIRSINQCLRLSDQHFVAARAQVLKHLSILKNP